MLSPGHTTFVNAGVEDASLECEFRMTDFSMFGNPIFWKKRQLGEESLDVNFMGNILQPFFETNRMTVEFVETRSHHYRSTLRITGHIGQLCA